MAILVTTTEEHVSIVEKWDIWCVIVLHKGMPLRIAKYALYVGNLGI